MNLKKILALVLVLAMLVSMVPTYAFAEDVELWDEEEVAVQDDAALEDVYLDEEPEEVIVEDEPEATEPEAVEVEEPAAEEPAAVEEPAAASEAAPVAETVLSTEETNDFEAGNVAMLNRTGVYYTSLGAAVDAAAENDMITIVGTPTDAVFIQKSLTIQGDGEEEVKGTITMTSGTLTLKNLKVQTINVGGGTLSIPAGDTGNYGTVTAAPSVQDGDVKGGTFASIPTKLLAVGYVAGDDASGVLEIADPCRGTVRELDLTEYLVEVENTDGSLVYFKTTGLTQINDKTKTGATVTLLATSPATASAAISFSGDKIIALDLNEKTFNGNITNGAKLTITNGTVAGTITNNADGTLTLGTGAILLAPGSTHDGIAVTNDGTTVLNEGASVTGQIENKKTLTMNAGTITNTNTNGIAIVNGNNDSTVEIKGGSINAKKLFGDTATGKITITGEGTFTGTMPATAAAGIFEISGGTYSARFNEGFLKEGYIIEKDGESFKVVPGEYAVHVRKVGTDTDATAYSADEFSDAVAAAKAGYKDVAKQSLYLDVEKGEWTVTFAKGDNLRVKVEDGAKFIPALADSVNTYFVFKNIKNAETEDYTNKLVPKSTNPITISVEGYVAQVGETRYKSTEWNDAVDAAKSKQNAVLKPLVTGKSITLSADDFINVVETSEIKVDVNPVSNVPAGYQIVKVVGDEYNTYKCVIPTASYEDAEGKTVYTLTFNEAATKAAENPVRGTFKVTLYKAPEFDDTTKDVYALGADSTLIVVATNTDVKTALEANVTHYNAELYKLIVTNDGEVAVKVTHTAGSETFTYEGLTPVAKSRLNTEEPTFEYFSSMEEAVKFVVEEHYNDYLVLTPLKNDTYAVTKAHIEGTDTKDNVKYLNRAIRIDNSGDFILKLQDVDIEESGVHKYYTYTATPGDGYTNYILNPATVKIPAKPEMNIYYDTVPGSDTKFFASFADAIKADRTAVVELIATPTDAQDQFTTETYKLGIPDGPITVKAKLNGFNWLIVKPYDETLAVKAEADPDDEDVTVYSLDSAVASITFGTGTAAETVLYSTFAEAASAQLASSQDPKPVIELINSDLTEYALANDATLTVEKNGKEIKVVAAIAQGQTEPTKAILETLGEDGITTTYASVDPVAEINFGTQAKPDVKLYGSFADAVKAAYTPAGTEATLVIELIGSAAIPATDKYEVTAAGSFIVNNMGNHSENLAQNNLSYAEDAPVVHSATADPVGTDGKIWRVTVAKAAASAAFPAGTQYYATFAAAAGEASNTSLAGAVTITLLDDVNDVYKLNTSHFMKVAKGTYKLDVEANNPTSGDTAYYIDEVEDASTGVTSYSPTKAAASVGTGTDIKYYATFDEAATASAGTKTITLYNNSNAQSATYSYVLGAEGKVSELHVEKNGQILTVTSGVTGREVKYTTGSPVVYTLISPVAHTEVNGVADKYFGVIGDAVAAAAYSASSTSTPTKTLVLDAAVTADIKLADGKQIDLKAGSYLGTYKVVAANTSANKTYFVVPTPNGDVTNYKSTIAVASIGTGADIKYYATFEAAAAEAYVTGDATPTKTVVVLQQPQIPVTDSQVVPDLFEVTEVGSILIDKSASTSINVEPNFDLADGLVYTYESKGSGKFLIKIVEAEAYTIRNNGVDKDYYETVAEACAVSARYLVNPPVVYLMKSELSYALAKDSTIRVNKMGYDDFAVTKATPTELEPKYAIVETVNGDVSTYTTKSDNLIARVNFDVKKPVGDYGMETVNNYVYYTKFADAAKAANGEKAITLLAALDEEYTLGMDETVIIATNTDVTGIKAPEGYALNSDNESVSGQITYTVVSCVATVNYKWETNKDPYDKPYGDLADALKDAIALYDGNSTQSINGAYLTLWAPVAEDFTYKLGEKDWIRVKNVEDYEFNVTNFVAPNGYYASFTTNFDGDNNYTIIMPARALASIGEGADIQYFDDFTAAVNAAVKVETDSGHYGDVQNPQSVITLYADNKDGYTFNTPSSDSVLSLLIKAGEHKTNLTAPNGYFVEVTPANQEGVSKYEVKQKIASVTTGPNNDRHTEYYSSFSAAASAALDTVETVRILVASSALSDEDIFEMPVGTLSVTFIEDSWTNTQKNSFANNHITVKAEQARLISEKVSSKKYTYTVSGAVASITTSRGTSMYNSMYDAIEAAINNDNLVIVPLTDIDYYMTAAEVDALVTAAGSGTDATGYHFKVEDNDYEVLLRTEGYELVEKDNIYTFTKPVAYVITDEVFSVDPATNRPTYINQYFSKFEDAVDFAANTATIVLLDDVTYEFKDVDTVINLWNKNSKALNRSCYIPGYEMVREDVENSNPQIVKFYVAGYETITLDAGDGAWTKGTESRSILTGKAVTGVDIQNLKTDDKASADQWQIFGTDSVGLPTLTGYKPAYWVDDEGNKYLYKFTLTDAEKTEGYNPLPDKMPKGGITLTAVWVPNEYWVDYRTNIDNSVKTVKFTYGELLEVPEGVNVRENYEFAGWFTSADCKPTQAFDIANTKITNELGLISDVNRPATGKTWQSGEGYITLYAKFVPKQFTVTFDTLCDTVIPNQRVDFNSQIVKPTTALTKEGYTFSDSWHYINADGETHTWNFSDPVTGDITLIADWDAKQLRLIWADGSYVIQRDEKKDVGTPTDAPDYSSRTNPGYRIDPAKAWIDDDGDLFTGKVPVKDATQWIYRLNWIEQINVIFVDGGKKLGQVTVDKGTTLADAKDVPAPTKEGYTLVWQLEGEDYDVKAPIQEELLLTASWVDGQDVSDYATVVSSLSLRDNINLNGYVTIKENTLPGDYEVKVEFNGKTMMEGTLDTVGTYVESSGEYKLSDIAVIAAPQMNDAATVTITYQGKEVLSKDLTVRAYAEEWIEKSSNAKLVELLKALLDFGAYSQIQFNYQTNNLANSKYSTGKVPTTVVPVYSVKVDGSATGITGASTSLTLVSNTALNVYFAVQKTGSYKFAVDGNPVKATYSNKEYKVVLENILVADLDTEHVFTATLNGETYTMTCAPLAYAYQHQNDGNALGDVCKAVYVYFDAADAYFG